MHKIYSLIPHLHSLVGHQHTYHSAFQQAVEELGHSFEAFIPSSTACTEIPPKWIPFSGFYNLLKSKEEGIFFLETFNTKDLASLFFATLVTSRKKKRLWILLRYGKTQRRKSYFFFLRCLKWRLRERLTFFTDSEEVGTTFPFTVHLLPIPHTTLPSVEKKSAGPLVCLWPGEPRPSKGLKEIEALFSLQDPAKEAFLLPEPHREKTRHEYLEELFKGDILLLPYDPIVYRYGTSGVFVEGVVAGKMPVVKEGSWLALELKKHDLQELVVEWGHPQFFTHLKNLYESERVQKKLDRMKEKYRSFHSLKGFKEELKKFL